MLEFSILTPFKEVMALNTNSSLVQVEDLSLKLSNRSILQNINLSIKAGEILSLIGPNGAGKSSLVKCMVGLVKPSQGKIHRAPNLKIGYMPQRIKIARSLPITVTKFLKLGQKNALVDEALKQVGLDNSFANQFLYALSGGEWQRVLLARALLRHPNLLVLDEPAQGVDLSGQAELYNLLGEIRDKTGCAVFLVSHDLTLVMAKTDNVICLNQHVCCYGHPEAVGQDPAFLNLFGEIPSVALYTHHHDHQHDVHGEIINKQDDQDHE